MEILTEQVKKKIVFEQQENLFVCSQPPSALNELEPEEIFKNIFFRSEEGNKIAECGKNGS